MSKHKFLCFPHPNWKFRRRMLTNFQNQNIHFIDSNRGPEDYKRQSDWAVIYDSDTDECWEEPDIPADGKTGLYYPKDYKVYSPTKRSQYYHKVYNEHSPGLSDNIKISKRHGYSERYTIYSYLIDLNQRICNVSREIQGHGHTLMQRYSFHYDMLILFDTYLVYRQGVWAAEIKRK